MSDLNDRSLDVSITNEDKSKKVTVITDGSEERVAANIIQSTTQPSQINISALTKAGYVYTIPLAINMGSTGSTNPLILIKNPSDSGKRFYLYKITFGPTLTTTVTVLRAFSNPTITANGTTQTPVNLAIGGGFGASAMQVFSLPTISANGTLIHNFVEASGVSSFGAVTDFGVQLLENNNLLISAEPSANNRELSITIIWAEF